MSLLYVKIYIKLTISVFNISKNAPLLIGAIVKKSSIVSNPKIGNEY